MSHPVNDMIVESIQDTLDRLEDDLLKTREERDQLRAVVEEANEYIDACVMAHHGPYKRQKKDALHRLYEAVENWREWENDS